MTSKKRSKKQKRKIRKSKELQRRQQLQNRSKDILKKPPRMGLYMMPELFPPEMTREQREQVLKDFGKKHRQIFEEKFPLLEKWFSKYDSVYLLSFIAVYLLTFPEGSDPEAKGTLEFYEFYLEILHALALTQKRCLSVKPLHEEAEAFIGHIKEIGQAIGNRFFEIPDNIETEEDYNRYHARHHIISDTTAVRNWAYYHQMKSITKDLAKKNEDYFSANYGLNIVQVVELLFSLGAIVEERLNIHRKKVRDFYKAADYERVVDLYNKAFPENIPISGEKVEEIWKYAGEDLESLKNLLVLHSDLKLENIYTFDINELVEIYGNKEKAEKVRILFDKWSFSFGDLKSCNREHIILDNPIHDRIFIKIEKDKYFCPVICVLPHFILQLIECIIFEDEEQKRIYTWKIKSEYLQKKTENLFRENFPNASIYPGSEWFSIEDNKKYENDLLVVLDNFAIVVEMKSGMITRRAQRGAPERLERTINELIVEPSLQANRFIKYLKENRKEHEFSTKNGGKYKIDSSLIDFYIPIGVTLSEFGSFGSNIKELIKAGFIKNKIEELAPSISISALEIIFDLLPLESQKIHYLSRRREFERNVNYHADEIDLLGFYLENGFNIGDKEFGGDFFLSLVLKSKEIDPYYTCENMNIQKPRQLMTDYWNDLLETISLRKPERWCEVSYILLSTPENDQKEFEYLFNNLKKRVKKGQSKFRHNWIDFLSGPEQRRFYIGGYPYRTNDKKERNEIMMEMLENQDSNNILGAMCIGCHVKKDNYPYNIICYKKGSKLLTVE